MRSLLCLLVAFSGLCTLLQESPERLEYAKRVEIERRLAKQAGLPLTHNDLPKLPYPPSQNALIVLKQIEKLSRNKQVITPQDSGCLTIDMPTKYPSQTSIAYARGAIVRTKPMYDLIDKFLACPYYQKAINWSKTEGGVIDAWGLMEGNGTLRTLSRWLDGKSKLLVADGKYVEAIHNEAKGLRLAHLAEAVYPSLTDWYVAEAIRQMALAGITQILEEYGTKPNVATAVAEALEKAPPPAPLSHVVPMETLQALTYLHFIREQTMKEKVPQKFLDSIAYEGKAEWVKYGYPTDVKLRVQRLTDAGECIALARMRLLYQYYSLPYYKAKQKNITSNYEAKRTPTNPDFCTVTGWWNTSPPMSHTEIRTTALRLRIVAARVLEWRVKHGHLPETLQEVFTSIPTSTLDGNPIQYRKEGVGFVVKVDTVLIEGNHMPKESVLRFKLEGLQKW